LNFETVIACLKYNILMYIYEFR